MVDLLLERGARVVDKDKKGRNAIWYAIRSALILQAVLKAIETTPDLKEAVHQSDEDDRTALHACAIFGCARSAQLILDAGDTLTLMSQVDRDGKTPLHLAAERGNADVVGALLLDSPGTLPAGCTGHSVIELALRKWDRCLTVSNFGHKRTLELLLDHITPIPESLRPELLFFAVESGSLALCRRLVKLDSQLTRLKDRHGWTPLMLAMQNRDHGMVQTLLAFDGADELDNRTASATAHDDRRPSGWGALPWYLTSSDKLELLKTCKHRRTSALLQSNHPIPFGMPRYYWELEIVEAMETSVGIGVCGECRCQDFSPGWYYTTRKTWVYRGQDGRVLATCGPLISTRLYDKPNWRLCPFSGPTFTQGDTVGCGVDFVKGAIFFTKDGALLGKCLFLDDICLLCGQPGRPQGRTWSSIAKRLWTGDAVEELPHCRLFPAVVISGRTMWIKANFGADPSKPFKYDPSRYRMETEPQINRLESSVDA